MKITTRRTFNVGETVMARSLISFVYIVDPSTQQDFIVVVPQRMDGFRSDRKLIAVSRRSSPIFSPSFFRA